jgi:hypothetical protein
MRTDKEFIDSKVWIHVYRFFYSMVLRKNVIYERLEDRYSAGIFVEKVERLTWDKFVKYKEL